MIQAYYGTRLAKGRKGGSEIPYWLVGREFSKKKVLIRLTEGEDTALAVFQKDEPHDEVFSLATVAEMHACWSKYVSKGPSSRTSSIDVRYLRLKTPSKR